MVADDYAGIGGDHAFPHLAVARGPNPIDQPLGRKVGLDPQALGARVALLRNTQRLSQRHRRGAHQIELMPVLHLLGGCHAGFRAGHRRAGRCGPTGRRRLCQAQDETKRGDQRGTHGIWLRPSGRTGNDARRNEKKKRDRSHGAAGDRSRAAARRRREYGHLASHEALGRHNDTVPVRFVLSNTGPRNDVDQVTKPALVRPARSPRSAEIRQAISSD